MCDDRRVELAAKHRVQTLVELLVETLDLREGGREGGRNEGGRRR